MDSPIRFWRTTDEYGWLCNFAPYPIVFEGLDCPTSEHAYQLAKTLDPVEREFVRTSRTPRDAKYRGREGITLRDDWDHRLPIGPYLATGPVVFLKDAVMYDVLLAKFGQHPDLKKRLLATGDKLLIEASPKDAYWGEGADGKGVNRLGLLLVAIRDYIRNGGVRTGA